MSCQPEIVKEYFLGELPEAGRQSLERHLQSCESCGEELGRLQLTHAALMALPDQEPPRRIAFVSDKVFEPNWWQRLWQSGPRLGFASAGVLSAALLVHTFARPVVQGTNPAPSVDLVAVRAQVRQELMGELRPLIEKAVAEQRARQQEDDARLIHASLKDFESRFEKSRQKDRNYVAEAIDALDKQTNAALRSLAPVNQSVGAGE